jgi:hypothetical protein
MRQFLTAAAGSLLGMAVAMLVYDVYIARPREARLLEGVRTIVAEGSIAWPAGDAQREQAKQIAKELDASVTRSVEGAREALAQEAALMDRRARIADGLTRAQLHKISVAEGYQVAAAWPSTAQEIGLAPAESYAANSVSGIALEPQGRIAIHYGDPFPAGAVIRLTPALRDTGIIEWSCRADGFDDRSLLPSQCR